MAIAIIQTKGGEDNSPASKYITSIPNAGRTGTRELIHKIEESTQSEFPTQRAVQMRDDYQVPEGADQITYREYLSQYATSISGKGEDSNRQKKEIEIILSSLP